MVSEYPRGSISTRCISIRRHISFIRSVRKQMAHKLPLVIKLLLIHGLTFFEAKHGKNLYIGGSLAKGIFGLFGFQVRHG